ncbi:sugar ABC transporter ATP-binding protein [Donghicola sp.]|jgi:simple sugar transport system ATP-binding protein|uniref:sugar ABC transporter ATP-binding protein n=1 Tax=Donghicola sp. TaxID=1929294 RepID=UPI0025E956A5|nr:sugar ABC transporter ATP-binding protein [Donghicola sp.]MCT4577752.1 sugar ABC transporter ATP-binding protein [Donghicola sp.]
MTTASAERFALRLHKVSKAFGGVQALNKVDFEVRAGEVHCLAGENGCGKSTLIKVVTGVHRPESAELVELFGQRIDRITPVQARELGVSVIWQDLALFPHMSVAENIAFDDLVGLRPKSVRYGEMTTRAGKVLERLGVKMELGAPLHSLPIAQRQVVAIARALMNDAKLIFMDEPTASLTQSETDRLLDIVRKLSAEGVAIVFVSHRLAEVLEIAERVTVVRDGNLVGVYPTEGMTQARLGELMTGHHIENEVSARDLPDAPIAFQAHGLSRHGEFHDVDLTIRAGEVVGLTGLIGAGRTELAHVMMGMRRADGGDMQLNGAIYRPKSVRAAIEQGMAYVSEDRLSLGLLQKQSIADNTVISVLRKLTSATGLISESRKAKLVRHWIKELGVKIGAPEDPISTLSGGNQQKVVLAKWLATDPKLLILDSPTVGVDVGARAGIFRIVRQLADEGLAILLISDEVTEVMHNSDRILHMADGCIQQEYDPRTISVPQLEERIYA